jgi:hypothetical protein
VSTSAGLVCFRTASSDPSGSGVSDVGSGRVLFAPLKKKTVFYLVHGDIAL